MEAANQQLEKEIYFGVLTDTPILYFLKVMELNKSNLNIHFTNPNITIAELITQYKQNSSFINKFKGASQLLIQQGPKKGQIAVKTEKLANLQLDYNKVCFTVVDSADENFKSLIMAADRQRQQMTQTNLWLTVRYDKKSYPLKLNIIVEIQLIKRQILAQINTLNGKTPDQIRLTYNGMFLQDKRTLQSFDVKRESVLDVMAKRVQGCFHQDMLVTMANGNRIKISEIKVGDRVMSYNQEKKIFEEDLVSFVEKTKVEYAIHMTLSNNTTIITTSNHYFLCDDGHFRCITAKDGIEKSRIDIESSLMATTRGNSLIVKQIIQVPSIASQTTFYHLSITKNHNYIINDIITHNMTINVYLPDGTVQIINFTPMDRLDMVRDSIEDIYYINKFNQKLTYAGREVMYQKTFADQNICKDSKLYLEFKEWSKFNAIKEGTPVLTLSGKQVKVEQLKNGDKIATINPSTGTLTPTGDTIEFIQRHRIDSFVTMNINTFQRRDQLIVATDSYVQLSNGQISHCFQLAYDFPEYPDLFVYDNNVSDIRAIAHQISPNNHNFYRLLTVENSNFIARSIIFYNHLLTVVVRISSRKIKRLTVPLRPNQKIQTLRNHLNLLRPYYQQQLSQINFDQIPLIFNGTFLKDQQLISDLYLQNYHVIIAEVTMSQIKKGPNTISKSNLLEHISKDKTIDIHISKTQRHQISYQSYKNDPVQKIVQEIMPKDNSYYFFFYANIILYPTDQLNKIQRENSQEFKKHQQITLLMVKNQKLAFLQKMNISKDNIRNHSCIIQQQNTPLMISTISQISQTQQVKFFASSQVQKAAIRIQADKDIPQHFKNDSFYNPFLMLTSGKYKDKIFRYIRNFQSYSHEYNDVHSIFTIIKDLYCNIQLLPNYYGQCYLGVKNFMFSRYFKELNTFYLHSFTIAFQSKDSIEQQLKHTPGSGTLFCITSLNGRQISKFSLNPNLKQILFAPFTAFLIQKIETKANYDIVYLVELSSPISFQKDIVLWVDDQPRHNIRQIESIYKKYDVEILQAKSTIQAQKWIQQFGWLLNWKGLRFKLISDMARVEGIGNQQHNNDRAGIDLLQRLYNFHGITTHTMIYCQNIERANNLARQSKIPTHLYTISKQRPELIKYICGHLS